MGWIVVFVLHLFCGMAAMAGVHSSAMYQEFEGDAVHSIMRSWVATGTNSSWLTDTIGWSFEDHPCINYSYSRVDWEGVICDSKLFQQNASTSTNTYYFLTSIFLDPPTSFVVDNVTYTTEMGIDTAKFVGGLPPAILSLTNLQYLYISDATKLSGTLPPGIFCHLINLQTMILRNCSFNGSISIELTPSCDGNFALEYLDLSWNSFTSIMNLGAFFNVQYLYVRNNSIVRFPIELFESKTLQEIYLDFNNISSFLQDFSDTKTSRIEKISMSNNKLQSFPGWLLQLPKLEEIILDFNHIARDLHLPNISCQNSKIKLISLLDNNIANFYPSNDSSSCFSESRILLDDKIFLGRNPICTNQSFKTKVLQKVCRSNASSPIEELNKKDVKPNLYSFTELKVATQDFHARNELGRGGFGIVYKGTLSDGSHVAVKKLTKLSVEQGIQDFLSEIITVSNIKHHNLVQLKGCCIKENQRILVHEFVENKNLANALWGGSKSIKHLDWPTCFNIILGIARGLAYLHEEVQLAIIHRDIKGENILLDKHFHPKIADFGLALFFPSLDDGETHMNVTKVAGTMGYMAPEYLCYGQVSSKLDVFSFGILLLEIVSGRKNIDLKSSSTKYYLVQWAQELYANDNLSNLRDKSLEGMTLVEDAKFQQVVKVGLRCLHHIVTKRPIMSEVVAMLLGNKDVDDCALEDYDEGSSLSYAVESSGYHSSTTKSYLQCLTKDTSNLHLDFECHHQSLQLSELKLLSK